MPLLIEPCQEFVEKKRQQRKKEGGEWETVVEGHGHVLDHVSVKLDEAEHQSYVYAYQVIDELVHPAQQLMQKREDVMERQVFYAVQGNQCYAGYAPDYVQLADDAEVMWEE
jgi:hypothetical protein